MSQFRRAAFLLFFICSTIYASDSPSGFTSKAPGDNHIVCPSRNFSEFIKVFSENSEVQMMFTKFPLKQQRLDLNAEPEPKPILRKLRRDQVLFPIIPNEDERKKKMLVLRIDKIKKNQAKLTVMGRDTDYQINYFFIRNSCWNLERVEDWSH